VDVTPRGNGFSYMAAIESLSEFMAYEQTLSKLSPFYTVCITSLFLRFGPLSPTS
jgi:hypothetical protein